MMVEGKTFPATGSFEGFADNSASLEPWPLPILSLDDGLALAIAAFTITAHCCEGRHDCPEVVYPSETEPS